jgi:hypothetical protein
MYERRTISYSTSPYSASRERIQGTFGQQTNNKSCNATDGILSQFVALSELLLEINKNNDFYCRLSKGDEQWKLHAQCLMDADPLIPPHI